MRRVMLCTGVLLAVGLGGCRIHVSPEKKKRETSRLVVKDGDDEVTLKAGAGGVALSVRSGEDEVTLKATDLKADLQVDEPSDTVSLLARVKSAVLAVRSGEDHVDLKARNLKADLRVKSRTVPVK